MSNLDKPIPLYGHEFKRDPYPTYTRLRRAGAVHRVEFPSGVRGWLVTGYDAARQVLSDTRLGKNHALGNPGWRRLAAIMPEPQHSELQVHLLHQDPPKHTVMRRLLQDAFAPRRLEGMRNHFRRLADDLLDDMPRTGPVDVVQCFAAHFPLLVLSEVIGLPPALMRRFRREWCKVVQPVGPCSPQRDAYIALLVGLQEYIEEVAASKRESPGGDLLSQLVQAQGEGVLGQEELASMIFQLLVAGQEPVTNQMSTALMALLTHPEHLAALREDAALLPGAVDELLRYDSAFELTTWRFFKEPTVLHGVTIPGGDPVIVSLCAASRDPARFRAPDELDFGRTPNPHLAFGHGIHYCAGAALARIELQVAIGALLVRLPGLRLDTPADNVEWISAVLARGVDHLPVTFAAEPLGSEKMAGQRGPRA